MTPKEDAEVMLETIQHPERFCQICGKRNGICIHTRNYEQMNRNEQQEYEAFILEHERTVKRGRY